MYSQFFFLIFIKKIAYISEISESVTVLELAHEHPETIHNLGPQNPAIRETNPGWSARGREVSGLIVSSDILSIEIEHATANPKGAKLKGLSRWVYRCGKNTSTRLFVFAEGIYTNE